MRYVFYDLETTGTNVHWDQIIQFAAMVVDENFNYIDSYESRCSLKTGTIPIPQALIVNKTSIKSLDKINLSHYGLVLQVVKKLKEWSPAIFFGYNSISFDEEFLRNTFLKTLFNPYITILDGNRRGDILNLVRSLNLFFPDSLKFPKTEKGKTSFKLENLAPLNGINHMAHDAMGDVKATIEIAKTISKNNPKLWNACLSSTSKEGVMKFINENKIFCFGEAIFGKPNAFVGCFLFNHPIYNYPQIFDLKHCPENLLYLSEKELKKELIKSPKIIRTIKQNKNPIMLEFKYYQQVKNYNVIGEDILLTRFNMLEKNNNFKIKLLSLIQEISEERFQEEELYGSQLDIIAEESLYNFNFPSYEDKSIMEKFHASGWEKKIELVNKFDDKRYSYFAKRLIFEEFPDLLPNEMKLELQNVIKNQIYSPNEEKWNTLRKTYYDLSRIEVGNDFKENELNIFKKDFEKFLKNLENELL